MYSAQNFHILCIHILNMKLFHSFYLFSFGIQQQNTKQKHNLIGVCCFFSVIVHTDTARVSSVFVSPLLSSLCRMFRLRALSAVSVGLAQLSRRYHSGAVRESGRRRLMLAALAGVTGVSASAGLLWKRQFFVLFFYTLVPHFIALKIIVVLKKYCICSLRSNLKQADV